jgi:hypothetical protein
MPSVQLVAYAFDSDAGFEGQLVGALERIESGGACIVDVLFLGSDRATGELSVFAMRGGQTGKIVRPALDFRLDAVRRRHATERTLRDGTAGMTGDDVKALGSALRPGSAVAAVLMEHAAVQPLDAAALRIGGTPLINRFADAAAITAELLEEHLPAR